MQAFGASDLTPGAPAAGVAQGSLLPTRIDGPFPLSGDPMTDAESLAGRANPGEVLLSEGLRRALHARQLPFAGRQAELALMAGLLERCSATRRGRTIVTRGEAGIGKTRLLEALIEVARERGTHCHRVQVLDFGQVKARRPLASLFASLLGISPDAGPAERGRAVVEAIESGRLPADSILHASGLVGAPLSADQASIERNLDPQALEHGRMEVVRRLDRDRLRESAAAPRHRGPALRRRRGGGAARGARGIRRGTARPARALHAAGRGPDRRVLARAGARLPADDARPRAAHGRRVARARGELSGARRRMIEGCIGRAQGHPLFLDQLLRAADAGETAMPPSVQALVLSRVERLGREDRQALLAASVLGLRFPREALAAMPTCVGRCRTGWWRRAC